MFLLLYCLKPATDLLCQALNDAAVIFFPIDPNRNNESNLISFLLAKNSNTNVLPSDYGYVGNLFFKVAPEKIHTPMEEINNTPSPLLQSSYTNLRYSLDEPPSSLDGGISLCGWVMIHFYHVKFHSLGD